MKKRRLAKSIENTGAPGRKLTLFMKMNEVTPMIAADVYLSTVERILGVSLAVSMKILPTYRSS